MSADLAPIRFNRPATTAAEVDYLREALTSAHTSAGGPFSTRAAEVLRTASGSAEALLTTSCTAALELSGLLLDVGPEDTVIVPSFAFTSTALAYARQGAKIRFCDIEPRTLGPDPAHVADLLDETVKAVVVLHYAGIACDMAGLQKVLAPWPEVAVIEDNAHGLFGSWRGQPLGSLGRFATLSFHETKNIVCGEGGALLLNDPADIDRAQILYDKGTDRQAFFKGQVDKYSWRDTGSSFGLSDLLAAYLMAQLDERERIQARRREIWQRYHRALTPLADELGIQLPHVPDDAEPAWHLYHLLLPDPQARGRVIADLKQEGIATAFHYVPLHDSDAGRRFSDGPAHCPVSGDVSARLLRLPFHVHLGDDDVDRVIERFVAAARRHR